MHSHRANGLPRAIFLYANDGCLTVARVLRSRGVEVRALTDERHRYVLAARGVRGRVMPHIREDPDAWMSELNRLAAIGGGVVISGSDEATAFLAHHRAQLPASLRTFESTDDVHLALMDKSQLYRIATVAGLRVPWVRRISEHDELEEARGDLTYPCILKPGLGHLSKSALGIGTTRLASDADLMEPARRLLDHGIEFLLTQLVPGPETALEGAVTIRNRDGSYLLEYGRHKIRQWPPDYGTGSVLESVDVPDMLRFNRRLLDFAGFHGLSSCEAKRHAETGELYLIEINVRVPANYGLSHACGVDGAWRLYAALAGLPLDPQPQQVQGRKVVMHPDLIAVAAQLRARVTSPRQILASWRGTRDFGAWSVRDPLPALVLAGQMLRRAGARLGTRLGPNRAVTATTRAGDHKTSTLHLR